MKSQFVYTRSRSMVSTNMRGKRQHAVALVFKVVDSSRIVVF